MDRYHENYSRLSDGELEKRLEVKRLELKEVFARTGFASPSLPIRVAVIGCADRRLIEGHRRIFSELSGKEVELTTLDISTDHLKGESGVIRHDARDPLPGGPYDITYAHVLLKFIPENQRRDVIRNSIDALRSPGMAVHVLNASQEEGRSEEDGLVGEVLETLRREKESFQAIDFDSSGVTGRNVRSVIVAIDK